MTRIARIAPVALLLASACAHDDGSSTTTVTSGATSGVKVTNTRTPQNDELALRLANELCAREHACNQIRPGPLYRSEEACMAEEGVTAPEQLSRWACLPTAMQAGFANCLAAIRLAPCDTLLPRADVLPSCRSAPVCTTK
jgi:Family of unknown function (DUF6184)